MAKRFGYTGKDWSCLWCGLKFKEGATRMLIKSTPAAEILVYQEGAEFEVDGQPRKVKSVSFQTYKLAVGKAGRSKWVEVGMGEQAEYVIVKWEPPKLPDTPAGLLAGRDDKTGMEAPLFCGKGCAAEFGRRMGELGKRLVQMTKGEEK